MSAIRTLPTVFVDAIIVIFPKRKNGKSATASTKAQALMPEGVTPPEC